MLKDFFPKKKRYATLSSVDTQKRDAIPEGVVTKCPSCGKMLISKELDKTLKTCPQCDHHFILGAGERIGITVDEGCFFEFDTGWVSTNPLDFPGYQDKLAKAQEQSGLDDAIVTGDAKIGGYPVVLGVMDMAFIGGSMGSVVGEKIARSAERAIERRCPLILFTASGGARMQESTLSLMQMAKTTAAINRLSKQGLLYISVLTDPTYGGVTASFASLGDIVLAETKARVGFAGPSVIEQTLRLTLPDDFQTAEFQLKHGMVDRVVHRRDIRPTLERLLALHAKGGEGQLGG